MIPFATSLADVSLFEPQVFGDERGFFLETWNRRRFSEMGVDADFVQDNHSLSTQYTLRGLHYQNPFAQGKLVWVIEGEVWDVAVDLRRTSPTYGKWEGYYLNDTNKRRLWIPPGFAHGFLVTSKRAQFCYKCTEYYHPEAEHTLLWNDPLLGIDWPLPKGTVPLLSPKDAAGKRFAECIPF